MIHFSCPECGSVLHAGDKQSGKVTPCLACGQPVIVPPPVRELKMGIPLPDEPDDAAPSENDWTDAAGAGEPELPHYRGSIWPRVVPLLAFTLLVLLAGGAVPGYLWIRAEREKKALAEARTTPSPTQRVHPTTRQRIEEVEEPKVRNRADAESVFERWDLPAQLDLPPSKAIPDDERRPGWNGEFHRRARDFVTRDFPAIKSAMAFEAALGNARRQLRVLMDVRDTETLVSWRKALPRLSKVLHTEYEQVKKGGSTKGELASLEKVIAEFDRFSQEVDAAAREKE
jgi:hypothetical protein